MKILYIQKLEQHNHIQHNTSHQKQNQLIISTLSTILGL